MAGVREAGEAADQVAEVRREPTAPGDEDRVPRDVDWPRFCRDLRRRLGGSDRPLSQERLAGKVGVSFSTVRNWEKGRTAPIPILARELVRLGSDHGVDADEYALLPL